MYPIHDAVRLGEVHRLARLAAHHDLEAVDTSTPARLTPLGVAAAHDRADAVAELVRLGAGVDRPDPAGWTPIDVAVEQDAWAAVAALLRAGATPSPKLRALMQSGGD